MAHILDSEMPIQGALLMDEIQEHVAEESFFAKNVIKEPWPKETGYTTQVKWDPIPHDSRQSPVMEKVPIVERTINLKQAAINSPDICLDDIRYQFQFERVNKNVGVVLKKNLVFMWHTVFRDEIIRNTQKRRVVYGGIDPATLPPGTAVAQERLHRRLNFFGKVVQPYKAHPNRAVVNRPYRRAAKQAVAFHPDTVHFLFPDLEHWAGDLAWRNIIDDYRNPEGHLGFYRINMKYAAKPIRSDLGEVITIIPRGILGWLWFQAWRLVKFVP